MTDPDAPDSRDDRPDGAGTGEELAQQGPGAARPEGRGDDAADSSAGAHDDAGASSSRVRTIVYVGAAALLIAAAGFAGWALTGLGGDDAASEPSSSPAQDCGPVEAQVLALDGQAVQPDGPVCLIVTERSELTVGAAALQEGEDLALRLETVDGMALGSADSTLGLDPMVTAIVSPGAYVGYVTALDGSDPPPYLVYGSALPAAPELEDTEAITGPSQTQCGDSVPLVTDAGEVEADGEVPYFCLDLTEPTFLVAGAESLGDALPDEGGPDLLLSIARFDEDGAARVLRSNDDAFGYDPELTIDLEEGSYLVSVSAWFGEDPGAVRLYAGPAGSVMRTGEVSTVIADVTEAECEVAPGIAVGEALTLEGEVQYLCLDNPEQQRLLMEVATLGDQDLVLEVVQFVDGEPRRVAWADSAPDASSLAETDPALDRVFPEGRLLIAVTTYFGGAAADYDLRVTAAS
ncbi:hypothetical protein [Demequina zhanjiangensis]|uniref:Peptidase C-terminal archaeal/bacterial domain-containing protein n=1 Tax=Demequina zhanjiangensis TaxID=3051659 RepID=A0ABT8G314_9MICO|nr:hypothetical protein [Demequina sp. SYSU T00b26]MDN4473537.1 hypothetical protein [Demequina sp. SYSU T00b26]